MSKRINIIVPEETMRVLDRVALDGQSKVNLREQLAQAALANASLNLEIAEEWFPVENEAWQRLEHEEHKAEHSQNAARSTGRRSTRRSGTR